MNVEWIPSPNFTPASQVKAAFGRSRTTEIVVGHWWGDPNTNPKVGGVVSWFQNPRSQVSAHYVIGQGRIVQMVSEGDAAWHSRQANPFTVGIEINPNPTDDDYQKVGWKVFEIRQRRGNLPLKGHNVYVNTQCPGTIDLARIDRIANEYANPPQPEWIKNRVSVKPEQLRVLVSQAYIYDLRDGSKIKPLAYNTPIDFVAKTTVGGQEYYISKYSFDNTLPNGMRVKEVGIIPIIPAPEPTPPPVATIPDYKDKTIDTPDVKMYAQVDTKLVNFDTGKEEGSGYKRGQDFEIAAKTEFAGQEYYITVYSFGKKIWKGLPAKDLAIEKPIEKPDQMPGEPVTLDPQKEVLKFLVSLLNGEIKMERAELNAFLIRVAVTFVQGFVPAWALTNFSLSKGAIIGAGAAALSVVYNGVIKPQLEKLSSVKGA